MTREETKKILALICTIFPKAFDRAGAEATRNAWTLMFENEHYKVVLEAVKKVLRTSKFAPTIAEVTQEINTYKDILRSKLQLYNRYYAPLPSKCQNCTMYNDDERWLEKFKECGTVICPYDIDEEKRKQYYLTESQINEMRVMINGIKSKKLIGM